MSASSIVFDPLLSWAATGALAALAALMLGFGWWRGLPGRVWRSAAAALLLTAITNPSLQTEDRDPLSDIVLLVTDSSASQRISDRADQTETARAALASRIEARPGTELRQIVVGDGDDNSGTRAMTAVSQAIADIPQDRLAGVVLLSDGQVHDPSNAPALPAPMHLLLSGRAADWDRRLVVENAPAFAIIGEPVRLTVRIEDQGNVPAGNLGANLAISVDGDPPMNVPARAGETFELNVTLTHGGINVIHLVLDPDPGELTERNNSAIIQINGVRDRLSVLLVSGEPHPGGRTWRNLLKSDSAVDLVHFTILRPPEKQDGVPVNELSLIAFPTRELFLDKIDEFDLIIFDRYRRRGILPNQYLDNIRAYVEAGGAVLFAAGPEFASANSLFYSALGEIVPAEPTGRVTETEFVPKISEIGERHPVTEGMSGKWGGWLRQIDVAQVAGEAVMTGVDEAPLLILDRVGEGRIALLASDQAWLWARGYEGGGPQLELLRRLAHWMMKEPELEEEALSVTAEGQRMVITRRTLGSDDRSVDVTRPDGETISLPMTETQPGRYVAEYDGPEIGLYRLSQDDLDAVAALGPAAPKEFEETIATDEKIRDVIASSGGGSQRIETGIPSIRWVPEGRVASGRGWIGLTPRNASVTTAVRLQEILPAWIAVLLAGFLVLGGWLREGRK